MSFNNIHDFLQMGGYAQYVWPVYGVATVILFLQVVLPRRKHKKILKRLARQQQINKQEK